MTEFGREHVKLPFSARASQFDPDQTYWLREPANRLPDNSVQEIVVVGPPGSAKTTLFEVGLPFVISEDPGPTLVAFHTDPDAEDWMETRGRVVLENCEPVRQVWPDSKRDKKMEILFDHMPLWIAGANFSSLQVKSCRYVWGDECWRWKDGMMEEARARTHDRWNARTVFVSQGGYEKTEIHQAFVSGTQHTAHFNCPHCTQSQPYLWKQLKYDEAKDEEGNWDYIAAEKSARYECLNSDCKGIIHDDIHSRRSLAATCHYVQKNPRPVSKKVSYTYNALIVWWIPWGKLVVEWIKANEAKHRGDLQPLIKFKQKRLAEFWSEEFAIPHGILKTADYRKADYAEGQLWDGELYRFLTVDKQQDHFWAVVRAWKQDGSSRLLFESKVLTEEALRDIQLRYKVEDGLSFKDARYRPTDVYAHCAKFGWTAVFGSGDEGFTHHPRKGRPFTRYFSPIKTVDIGGDQFARYVIFSNERIKDLLSALRGGHGAEWEVPSDVSEAFLHQIDSEVKRDVVNKTTKQVTMRWVKFRDNHLWDCEVMQVLAANMFRLIGGNPEATGEQVDSEE